MSVLSVKNLALTYGDKVLYENENFDLYRGEHLGLVGENGMGKSTLFDIVLGHTHADDGKVEWLPKIKIGYLDQHARIDKSLTIREYLHTTFVELFAVHERLEKNLLRLETQYTDKLLKKVLNDQELLDEKGFAKIDSQIGKVTVGLGLAALGLDRKLSELSGGQCAKVILGKLLLDEPDVLLLDEPTNFLDKEHVVWLSLYLESYRQAFILISHDTYFLDDVTTHILHLDHGQLKKYRGNYSAFLLQLAEAQELQSKLYKKQIAFIEKTQDFIDKNRARATSARQAQSRVKMLNKIEVLKAPPKKVKPVFNFKEVVAPLGEALFVENLEVGYAQPLLPKLNFVVRSGKKVVVQGFNGIGKSTLIKTLVEQISALGGEFKFGHGTKVGYFEQDLRWHDPTANALEIVGDFYPGLEGGEIRSMLARYTLKSEKVRQPIASLSGGEQTKVKLALLALQPANFLILDEPTNHMDVLAKEALALALKNFSGTVLLVSHEEEFYKDWMDEVISLEQLKF